MVKWCFAFSPECDVIIIVDCVMIFLVYLLLHVIITTYYLLCALLTYNIIKQPDYLNVYSLPLIG